MKRLNFAITISAIALFANTNLIAQQNGQTAVKRTINFEFIGRDSIDLALSDNFYLIEDTCSQITRHAHLNIQDRRFTGHFTDVSRQNPNVILTEGTYNREGQKDGYFTTHYLNGNIQAKGSFKDNLYAGKWEMFYEDGKPKLTFEADGINIKIADAWDDKGVKTIDNGNGTYKIELDKLYWKGKLLNGRPEGTWKFVNTRNGNLALNTETFKDGVFVKGNNPLGDYKDSRLTLVAPDALPFVRAELLQIAMSDCNAPKTANFVKAHFVDGEQEFLQNISKAIYQYTGDQITKPTTKMVIDAEISERGTFGKFKSRNPDYQYSEPMITLLKKLPMLMPATLDGKPVKEKVTFEITFTLGTYRFTYMLADNQ